jgi:hypothetical protein
MADTPFLIALFGFCFCEGGKALMAGQSLVKDFRVEEDVTALNPRSP